MKINMITYTSTFLRGIQNISRGNYTSFNLSTVTRSWAKALGIRKQPMVKLYRRSRASQNLFRKIHVIVSTTHKYSVPGREVNTSNIRKIEYIPDKFKLNLSHINARSLAPKSTDFQQYLIQHDINICAVSETWLKEDIEPETLWEIAPQGYKIYSTPCRTGKQGGGLALVCKRKLKMDMVNINANITTMELVIYKSKITMHNIIFILVYHPPNTSVLQFCNELSEILKEIVNIRGEMIMIGDFNIHMDITDDPNTITFNDFLDSFNLHNHVNFPTHKSLHYLDLVITDTSWNIMHTVKQGHMLSDHNFIDCSLHIEKPKPQTKTVTYRKLKNIDIKTLGEDMGEALEAANNCSDLAALVDMYNVKLSAVLDNHAPQKTKTVKISHCQPWFNDFIKEQIVLRRKKEKTFRLDPTDYNYQAFYYKCRYVSNITKHAKKQYYLESIKNCDRDAKSLFNLANKLLFRKEPPPSQM